MRHFSLRSQNSEYPRIFRVTGTNQNARKLLSTDLVSTNLIYFTIQEEKTKAVQGRKNKKGGRKGDMPDEVSNNNSLKVSAHTTIVEVEV